MRTGNRCCNTSTTPVTQLFVARSEHWECFPEFIMCNISRVNSSEENYTSLQERKSESPPPPTEQS
ncbi:hypothetical protein E2C01_099483 [Portunus trituberculatus]|uniref:Uncharacterized protein n=1 Tax=Portunus trituberculatus TaxID=210409 RepID=A0A5B7KF36_PORTR|nr:hypothetical protein [Portunus trituberculatus]